MLPEGNSMTKLKFALAGGLLALTASMALAQADTSPEPSAVDVMLKNAGLENLPPEQLQEAKDAAAAMVKDILHAYEQRPPEDVTNAVDQLRRRADDIADKTIASKRDKVLEFLGIDPQSESALYYFVSWSMPLEMLRSYAIEAMWSGGTLVIKGVPPGKELGKFLVEDLRQLVYGKGAAAAISLDPRMFDAYGVTTVPTIVLTTVRDNLQCQGVNPVPFKVDGKEVSYDTCPELDPKSYWKVSGAVTSNYALQAFLDEGAVQAKPYLSALARGYAGQATPGRDQKPFVGEWKDVLSPSAQAEAAEEYKKTQQEAR